MAYIPLRKETDGLTTNLRYNFIPNQEENRVSRTFKVIAEVATPGNNWDQLAEGLTKILKLRRKPQYGWLGQNKAILEVADANERNQLLLILRIDFGSMSIGFKDWDPTPSLVGPDWLALS